MAAAAHQENVISLAQVRAERRAALPVSLDMDWDRSRDEEESWALGRTVWVAVAISSGLWAIIAGALWLV